MTQRCYAPALESRQAIVLVKDGAMARVGSITLIDKAGVESWHLQDWGCMEGALMKHSLGFFTLTKPLLQ